MAEGICAHESIERFEYPGATRWICVRCREEFIPKYEGLRAAIMALVGEIAHPLYVQRAGEHEEEPEEPEPEPVEHVHVFSDSGFCDCGESRFLGMSKEGES